MYIASCANPPQVTSHKYSVMFRICKKLVQNLNKRVVEYTDLYMRTYVYIHSTCKSRYYVHFTCIQAQARSGYGGFPRAWALADVRYDVYTYMYMYLQVYICICIYYIYMCIYRYTISYGLVFLSSGV